MSTVVRAKIPLSILEKRFKIYNDKYFFDLPDYLRLYKEDDHAAANYFDLRESGLLPTDFVEGYKEDIVTFMKNLNNHEKKYEQFWDENEKRLQHWLNLKQSTVVKIRRWRIDLTAKLHTEKLPNFTLNDILNYISDK